MSGDGIGLTELLNQEYENARFSSGRVENAGVDTVYLKLEKPEMGWDHTLLLRPDEAVILAWLLAGAAWAGMT